ncbi:alpha/beta fold hydrolase [bacterium]|nr:alpha/beta fold hydrolase [bacterium]
MAKLLGRRKAVVVGHSTGGYSALNLAMHQSPNVLGIVCIAGFHSGKWDGVEGQLVKLAGLGAWTKPLFVANLALAKRSRFIQRMFASFLANDSKAYRANPRSRRMLENIRPNVVEQDAGALFSLFRGISSLEVLDQMAAISVPCHLFAGTHDPVVSARQSLALVGKIPHAKTVVFQGVGHMPFIESTDLYDDALERALADIACSAPRNLGC